MLKLYNTLSKQKEIFKPLDAKNIRMYVCGPTVYDDIHIGNARPIVIFDVLFRLLKALYPQVVYVRNITDIDDKIINKSQLLKQSVQTIALQYYQSFQLDIAELNVLAPTYEPKATEHIQYMLELIKTLIDKSYAYVINNHVFFQVDTFAEYGALSGIKQATLHQGARIQISQLKKNPSDFVLWKPSSADEIGWQSPWGYGRPGWHLECSAMAKQYLGESFDIHGGGQDLIFPHHENERAQSICGSQSKTIMANYWLHNGYVMLEGKKMSKSLNNFISLKTLLKQYNGTIIRFALLSTHYRQPLNFQENTLQQASSIINKWQEIFTNTTIKASTVSSEILTALSDNLNTPAAITILHNDINTLQKLELNSKEYKALFAQNLAGLNLLGLALKPNATSLSIKNIELIIQERLVAKKNKDFLLADSLKKQLLEKGVILEDNKHGTIYKLKS